VASSALDDAIEVDEEIKREDRNQQATEDDGEVAQRAKQGDARGARKIRKLRLQFVAQVASELAHRVWGLEVKVLPQPWLGSVLQALELRGQGGDNPAQLIDEHRDREHQNEGGEGRNAEHDNRGRKRARHPARFEPVDERVERVGEQEGEKQRDEHSAQGISKCQHYRGREKRQSAAHRARDERRRVRWRGGDRHSPNAM